MLRNLSDSVLKVAARLRPRVRMRAETVKVNLGAGIEVAPGWLNVDGSIHAFVGKAPRVLLSLVYRSTRNVRRMVSEEEYLRRFSQHDFIFCDFANGLPFYDASVDYIFCSHVLEHFYLSEGEDLLGEMRRVLKPGGIVRICVPDLEIAIRHYESGNKREALRFFFTDERTRFDQHHYMYDYELVAELLGKAGFVKMRRCEYRQGDLPDLEVLDNRPEETLYVEATK